MRKLPFLLIRWLIIISWWHEQIIKKYLLKTRYKLVGKCQQCAICCTHIGVEDPEDYYHRPFLCKLVLFFYEKVYDFKFADYLPERKLFIFTCQHYDANERRCTNYFHRPAICRNYPVVNYFTEPEICQPCGFSTTIRDSL